MHTTHTHPEVCELYETPLPCEPPIVRVSDFPVINKCDA